MMSINNSLDTVNAAAAAIVGAEGRVQPVSAQKKRWASCWNSYWCFGSLRTSKRIGHAAFVPEPLVTESAVPIVDNPIPSTSTILPFIAPPSSPMVQSDPPTGTHSPVGLLALTPLSVNAYSSRHAHIFTIGPYAHETQLVSPPVFSAIGTEPSTAAVTPPPETVQSTTPSSPDVPFAQLLTSSLNRARRNSGTNHKLALSCYEIHHIISPGSANSASGTSSPYFDKRSILEFRMVDASKLFDSKTIYTRKWGSRLGSGSVTPDGTGLSSHESFVHANQISEMTSAANLETGSPIEETLVDHRVSFELTCEDTAPDVEKSVVHTADQQQEIQNHSALGRDFVPLKAEDFCKASDETPEMASGEMKDILHKQSSLSLGSVKEFNFESSDKGIPAESNVSLDWWADEKIVQDIEAESWSFFPLLQQGVS